MLATLFKVKQCTLSRQINTVHIELMANYVPETLILGTSVNNKPTVLEKEIFESDEYNAILVLAGTYHMNSKDWSPLTPEAHLLYVQGTVSGEAEGLYHRVYWYIGGDARRVLTNNVWSSSEALWHYEELYRKHHGLASAERCLYCGQRF